MKRVAHKMMSGSQTYPHRFHGLGGMVIDSKFSPITRNQSHRDNAHHTNPFPGYELEEDAIIAELAIEEKTLNEVQLYKVACGRFRQKSHRNRPTAQRVIASVVALAGSTMTRLEWSMLLCDLLLNGKAQGTKVIQDPWKKIRTYEAILEAFE